ncbi:hypothetical protein CJJ23_00680 [Mycoplasmopsis agassizii]|uniref:Uncharacterized protein n=1 Tax=Mycoplasmopsis agassizii TaxID=33922 RepID=A0A269TJH6_9BACT|nr:hypothetical protein [Mycoplasmopsis agassizii]PAK21643.1 hypothetical protein CJJ23_00680 [Mycoplasmopsis agassizii]
MKTSHDKMKDLLDLKSSFLDLGKRTFIKQSFYSYLKLNIYPSATAILYLWIAFASIHKIAEPSLIALSENPTIVLIRGIIISSSVTTVSFSYYLLLMAFGFIRYKKLLNSIKSEKDYSWTIFELRHFVTSFNSNTSNDPSLLWGLISSIRLLKRFDHFLWLKRFTKRIINAIQIEIIHKECNQIYEIISDLINFTWANSWHYINNQARLKLVHHVLKKILIEFKKTEYFKKC